MSRFCPHCRFPFDPDWGDELLPTLCPRCGQRLAAPSASNPRSGIASFLHKPAEPEHEPTLPRPLPPSAEAAARDTVDPSTQAPSKQVAAPVSNGIAPTTQADAATPSAADRTRATETQGPAKVSTPTEAGTSFNTHASPTATNTPSSAPSSAATTSAPTFTRSTSAPATSRRTLLVQAIIVVALLLALALQLLLADRARLAADAQWRPLLQSVCGVLGCALPAWHEPQALTMLNRDVRPVPGMPGALQVHAELRNDARWAQAMPMLQLSLADADGRRVGQRLFTPAEYGSASSTATLAPGQTAKITFNIHEPGTPAAAFQFEFR